MNRINLLRKSGKRSTSSLSLALPRWAILVLVAAIVLPAAIIVGLRFLPRHTVVKQTVVPKKPSPFKPSTYTSKASIVEEVVKEVGAERNTGSKTRILDIPYNELSFLEKVNYEVLFAKNVVTLFNRVVPAGIGLRSLELDNFQTLYAVGLGNTKELVSSTFLALKAEKLELLPQPFSYITSNEGDGFRFVVTCKMNLGLDLGDSFQASDDLPARDDLPLLTKKVVTIGEADSVVFTGTPQQVDAEPVGVYRRLHYVYKGTSTYDHFVQFLMSLYKNRVPCAFKKIDIKARTGTTIDLEMQVVFTVRE